MPIKSALSISCLIRHCLLYRPGFILAECCGPISWSCLSVVGNPSSCYQI